MQCMLRAARQKFPPLDEPTDAKCKSIWCEIIVNSYKISAQNISIKSSPVIFFFSVFFSFYFGPGEETQA